MYIPDHFKEADRERIATLIERYSFGMLVTTAPDGEPCVNHLPFVYDRAAGGKGKLLCHMGRENPQWRHFSSGGEVLVVFQGPHAYVSPSWYLSPGVPTWNYAVVHVRGKPQVIESETRLESLIEQLTEIHESRKPDPWQPNLSGERRRTLLSMIVGVEIDITTIQAKFKLSQNRPAEDQQRVIDQLAHSGNSNEVAVARLMSGATHKL